MCKGSPNWYKLTQAQGLYSDFKGILQQSLQQVSYKVQSFTKGVYHLFKRNTLAKLEGPIKKIVMSRYHKDMLKHFLMQQQLYTFYLLG